MKQSKTKIAYQQCEYFLANKQWDEVYKIINKKSVNIFHSKNNIFDLVKEHMVDMPIQPKKDLYRTLIDKGEKDFEDICGFLNDTLFKKNIKDGSSEEIDFNVSSEMLSVLDLYKRDSVNFQNILIFSKVLNNKENNSKDRNLAHYFSGSLSRDQMMALEKQGVDFMVEDCFGMYPLHYALFQIKTKQNISGLMYLIEKHAQKNIEISFDWDSLSYSNDLLKDICLSDNNVHSAFLTNNSNLTYIENHKDKVFSENINNLSICEMAAYSLFYSHSALTDVYSNLLVYLADRPELNLISGFDNVDFNQETIFHKIIKHRNKKSIEQRGVLDFTSLFPLFDILLETSAYKTALKVDKKGNNFLHLLAKKATDKKDLLIKLAESHINKSSELFQQKNDKDKSPLLAINKRYYHKLGPVVQKEVMERDFLDNKPYQKNRKSML